jgi:hypothetical protein
MSVLRNLGQRNPRGKGPWERRLLLWVVGAVVFAAFSVTAAYFFDVATESDAFCGQLCHPNRPEYVTHEVSPHAHVECGTCHIGPGLWPKVEAKIFGAGELFSLVANTYERPIELPVERMRPVEETCGQCHWSELSDEDLVRRIPAFALDEDNSETRTDLTVRINPGASANGQTVNGAHWHIDNPVEYIALDHLGQDVAWVGLMQDGQQVEYQAQGVDISPEQLERLPRKQLDCLDCHNRATHIYRKPERVLDEALAAGRVDPDLPFVKREGLALLSASYPTQEAGLEAMAELAAFYQSEYPTVASGQAQAIEQAVEVLREIYGHTTFPAMNLTWDSYPNNLGHADFPGCFRCHDGEHLDAQGESIPLNCTLCHSVPVTSRPGQEPDLAFALAVAGQALDKPASHQEASFTWDHRVLADDSCADCHGPIAYGTDNSSFCANGACHGQEWEGTALAAAFVHPVELVGQHAQALCSDCHQGTRELDLEDCAACHQPPSEPHFGTQCTECHTPSGWEESASSWLAYAPSSPHSVDATMPCLECHGEGGSKAIPASHQGIPSQSCLSCHGSVTTIETPAIPHAVGGADSCQTCHGEGQLKPASLIHEGIPTDSCLYCHQGGPVEGVPLIPHMIEGRDRCLTCHGANELAPAPLSHEGWTNEFCLLCHEAS